MPRLAYFDCPSGIAGDMCLGALVDAGVPLGYLNAQLRQLNLAAAPQLRAETTHARGQAATQVTVAVGKAETHERDWAAIAALLQAAPLPERAACWSQQAFRALAQAEGAVHGVAPERVTFHEAGAADAIADIVGTCLGLDWLGIEQIACSALPTGGGTVRAAHGELPVPVPAVAHLWAAYRVPVYSNGIAQELVTPTGAALAVALAERFGPLPAMTPWQVGLGAGSRELAIPNLLRLWLGDAASQGSAAQEPIAVLETQLDDLSPQAIAYTTEALFGAGAADVFTQAIGMKKSRNGILLTVVCPPERAADCEAVLFRETTTLGVRHSQQVRTALPRAIRRVETPLGPVRVKVAFRSDAASQAPLGIQPEYEDCAQLARTHDCPWHVVYQMAIEAWKAQQTS